MIFFMYVFRFSFYLNFIVDVDSLKFSLLFYSLCGFCFYEFMEVCGNARMCLFILHQLCHCECMLH